MVPAVMLFIKGGFHGAVYKLFRERLSEKRHATIRRKYCAYCGWLSVDCSSEKFVRMVREVMDVRLRMLKESNKSRLDSYSVRNSVLIISHITFRDGRVHIFFDSLSRNSCIIKALHLRVNVFSTKVLIEDTNRDGTTILHGHPCHAKVSPFSGWSPSFLSYFKILSIGPAPSIEPATSRSAVKCSTDRANHSYLTKSLSTSKMNVIN